LYFQAKKYSTDSRLFVLYGISQNPDTNDYILVFNWTSGNEKIDDFIKEKQLEISSTLFEWIPYHQFEKIKEIGKGGFATVYLAIWKNGPLHCNYLNDEYKRDPNKEVALKSLDNSQNSIDKLLNEVRISM
jgi:serine/threonine protein kinase